MAKILIVEKDEALRQLLDQRLRDAYDISCTSDFDQVKEMALQYRPDCILLGIEPELAGMVLCQKLASVSSTRSIPILVMSEEPAANYADVCAGLDVKGYVEKPIDCTQLELHLIRTLSLRRPERRRETRIHLRVSVKLSGVDMNGAKFELRTMTDDVSAHGFSCGLPASLPRGTPVDVFLLADRGQFAGRAKVVRTGGEAVQLEHYGFQFFEKPSEWVIR
jgi:DNA-binding response OmpR family regulator